ncbi:MAG TPA: hypothetical protein PK858_09880, partial [Saprospiraceae bacterium]|nr:hypothetical protein [Saprospiraceae bacterium]
HYSANDNKYQSSQNFCKKTAGRSLRFLGEAKKIMLGRLQFLALIGLRVRVPKVAKSLQMSLAFLAAALPSLPLLTFFISPCFLRILFHP